MADLRNLVNDGNWELASNLLFRYCDKGVIPASAVRDADIDLILFMEEYKLALPVSSLHGSLSWRMRVVTPNVDLEIPYVIRYFFKLLKERGEVSWREAVVEYFRDIGEENAEDFPGIFLEIVNRSAKRGESLIVCGEDIVDISMKYGRDGGVVIAEMKGAGLISPFVGCGVGGGVGGGTVKAKTIKAPLYEVNRFFALLSEQ